MCWGFPDDGWFFLLDSLCSNIQYCIDNPPYVRANTFQNWIGDLWNKTAWNHVLYPISNKFSYETGQKWFGRFNYQTRYVPAPISQVVASQVKEKFGSLRFYYSGGDDLIDGMVRLAESMSHHICESCGKMNEEVVCTGHGWVQTLCMKCRKPEDMELHLEAQVKYSADMIAAWVKAKETPEK